MREDTEKYLEKAASWWRRFLISRDLTGKIIVVKYGGAPWWMKL